MTGRGRTRDGSPDGGRSGGNRLLPVVRTPPDDDSIVAAGHSAASGCDNFGVNGMAGLGESIQNRVDTNRQRFLPKEGWVSHPMKKMRSRAKGGTQQSEDGRSGQRVGNDGSNWRGRLEEAREGLKTAISHERGTSRAPKCKGGRRRNIGGWRSVTWRGASSTGQGGRCTGEFCWTRPCATISMRGWRGGENGEDGDGITDHLTMMGFSSTMATMRKKVMDSPPTSRPALRRRVPMTIGAQKGEGKGHLSTAAATGSGGATG